MKYKVDSDLARKGLEEVLKLKINNIQSELEDADCGTIRTSVEEYYQARNIAKSLGIDTSRYDYNLIDMSAKLKRLGVEAK